MVDKIRQLCYTEDVSIFTESFMGWFLLFLLIVGIASMSKEKSVDTVWTPPDIPTTGSVFVYDHSSNWLPGGGLWNLANRSNVEVWGKEFSPSVRTEKWLHFNLNRIAEAGWELVSCEKSVYVFKRQKESA